MTRVLVVSHEELREQMSGPSIRNWELSDALAERHQVTLAVPGRPGREHPGFRVLGYDRTSLEALVGESDVVLCSGFLLHQYPFLAGARHLVADLYGPFQLEGLHVRDDFDPERQQSMAMSDRAVIRELARTADVFLCASARQRDFWMGWMDAVGRVNPVSHSADPGYERLFLEVPFGLPENPPRSSPPRYKGVIPGIGAEDYLVLWGGGIWNWFDPLTLVRAVAETESSLPQLRLFFPASTSPSEMVPAMRLALETRRLSDRLGLTGRRVFFGDGWVPYEQRDALFAESDLGVSLHGRDIETRFSFRTRVLDYLWAGIPVLTTTGDSMADLVESEDLGAVVPYGDVEAVAAALVSLAGDPARSRACGERAAAVGRRFRWSEVSRPLLEYCDAPWQAPDRALLREAPPQSTEPAEVVDPRRQGVAEVRRVLGRALAVARRDGPGAIAKRTGAYLRRRRT